MTLQPRTPLARWVAAHAALLLCVATVLPAAAAERSYRSYQIKGTLSYPGTDEPMVGAVVRLTPTDPDLATVEGKTDRNGVFVIKGLGFSTYAVVIETDQGETIRGVNVLPPPGEDKAELILKISNRLTNTALENQPDYFAAVISKPDFSWKRFWKQFAIYLGVTAATGVAAED